MLSSKTNKESQKRIALLKKKIEQGLTLAEAYELFVLEGADHKLVSWKTCETHKQKYLYGNKCPNC